MKCQDIYRNIFYQKHRKEGFCHPLETLRLLLHSHITECKKTKLIRNGKENWKTLY